MCQEKSVESIKLVLKGQKLTKQGEMNYISRKAEICLVSPVKVYTFWMWGFVILFSYQFDIIAAFKRTSVCGRSVNQAGWQFIWWFSVSFSHLLAKSPVWLSNCVRVADWLTHCKAGNGNEQPCAGLASSSTKTWFRTMAVWVRESASEQDGKLFKSSLSHYYRALSEAVQ